MMKQLINSTSKQKYSIPIIEVDELENCDVLTVSQENKSIQANELDRPSDLMDAVFGS